MSEKRSVLKYLCDGCAVNLHINPLSGHMPGESLACQMCGKTDVGRFYAVPNNEPGRTEVVRDQDGKEFTIRYYPKSRTIEPCPITKNLRDEIAIGILMHILPTDPHDSLVIISAPESVKSISELCYRYADEMMAARSPKKEINL